MTKLPFVATWARLRHTPVSKGQVGEIRCSQRSKSSLAATGAISGQDNLGLSMTGARALVVDDDPAVRRVIADMLDGLGVLTSTVADGGEALALLKHEPVDFILLDLHLRGEDGMSLAQQAVQLQPDAFTIVITGHPSFHSSVEAMRLGVCDYLSKPLSMDALQIAMQRAWRNRGARGSRRLRQSDASRSNVGRDTFVFSSAEMRNLRVQTRRLAELDKPVLIWGEKGVGKSRLARLIHEQSTRREDALVHVRCDALRDGQQDHGLFGETRNTAVPMINHSRNAFDQASGGTLILSDIDRLPLWAQVRLLEHLDRGSQPQGRITVEPPRIIATTAVDLKPLVDQGTFVAELYFRLNVLNMRVPPLRQRVDDIRSLASFFLGEQQRNSSRPAPHSLTDDAWQMLFKYHWPGNVAELANVIERASLESDSDIIGRGTIERLLPQEEVLPRNVETITIPVLGDLREMERAIVREVIHRCSGNKAAAARRLGMHRKTIYRLLQGDASMIS